MPKFPHYKQTEAKDCGSTCIKIIAKYYGKIINTQQLRTLSETTREGSSLLDFWSANCPPCRKQIREEFPILKEKYKKEDFVIVNYSLDTGYKIWKKTSISDGIDWVNITDLKGYKSDNVLNYQVRSIPKTIIIDKNGIIQYPLCI